MIYGCIGEKLSHSFSKQIHSMLFDYDYELLEIEKQNLSDFMKKREFKAINVTIPYKQDVIPYLDYISERAKSIRAVNTIINENGKLLGYNTDFSGLSSLIERSSVALKNKKVLVLGSGGTSKTALAVSKALEAKEVYRVSRTKKEDLITYDEAKAFHSDADIIINTTPLGMFPNKRESAVDINDFKNLSAVFDAVYNPLRSKLVCDAEEKGVKAVGGLYMLVAQGAHAAELFTGQKVTSEKIDEVYKSIVFSKQNIVLIGMAGCGKTTIGKILSEKLNMNFIDTDEKIIEKAKMPVPEIFEKYGEEHFRKLESEVIEEAAKLQNTVIATGGGAVLNHQNVLALRGNGRIYFLDRPLEQIMPTSDRPLSNNRETLEKRYNERYEIYKKSCTVHLKTNGIAKQTAEIIKEEFYNEAACN